MIDPGTFVAWAVCLDGGSAWASSTSSRVGGASWWGGRIVPSSGDGSRADVVSVSSALRRDFFKLKVGVLDLVISYLVDSDVDGVRFRIVGVVVGVERRAAVVPPPLVSCGVGRDGTLCTRDGLIGMVVVAGNAAGAVDGGWVELFKVGAAAVFFRGWSVSS